MIHRIIKAIEDSENLGLHKNLPANILDGYSGEKLVGLLQRLVDIHASGQNTCYLEIGVLQGLTLLSVAAANPYTPCYGIDNFAFFDPAGKNKDIIGQRMSRLNVTNAGLIEKDYEDALATLSEHLGSKKVSVYFIDGPHDYRSQLMCLELILPYLAENAVLVVDDSNYPHVRQANRDFLITHPAFKLIFEAYTAAHPLNMKPEQKKEVRRGWWNGINVIMHDPQSLLAPMFPPTERDRTLFENEHFIHAHRLAGYTPNSLAILDAFVHFRFVKAMKALLINTRKIRKFKNRHPERYPESNTESENLTAFNINRSENTAAQ